MNDKLLLSLMRAKYENDDNKYKKVAEEIIKEYDNEGKSQLAEQVSVYIGECATFVPMDNKCNNYSIPYSDSITCNECIHNDYECRNNTNNNKICEEFEWW